MILCEISFFWRFLQARSPEEAMAALMEATKIIGAASWINVSTTNGEKRLGLDMFGSILLKSITCFQKWNNKKNTSLDNQESNKISQKGKTNQQNLNKAFFQIY